MYYIKIYCVNVKDVLLASLLRGRKENFSMKVYIISIAVCTVICAVVNMLTPKNWTNYVGVVTGLVITLSIASPVIGIFGSDFLSGFSYTAKTNAQRGEAVLYNEIKTQLEERINDDAKTRLSEDFAKDCSVRTTVNMSDNGEVSGVKSIYVYGDRIDAVIVGKLREIYDAEEVKYVGLEKTPEKSE